MTPTAYAHSPGDPALLAAVSVLTQHITGLGANLTLLARMEGIRLEREAVAHARPVATPAAPAAPPPSPPARPPSPPTQERRPGSASADAEGGPLGRSLTFAAAKVIAFLAPVVALSNVLSQTVSGFGVLGTAIRVLGATVAPLLLPVFALLAAAVVAVSDELWDGLKEVLPAWYSYIMQNAVPAFVSLVAAVREVIDWFRKLNGERDPLEGRRDGDPLPTVGGDPSGGSDLWYNPATAGAPRLAIPPPVDGMSPDRIRAEWAALNEEHRRAATASGAALARGGYDSPEYHQAEAARRVAARDRDNYLGGFAGDAAENRRRLDAGDVPRIRGAAPPQPPGAVPGGAAGRPSPEQRYMTALRDVITSLRQGIAPPPAILATASVNQQAQKDALQQDPLERRMRERSLEALEMLLREIPKITQQTKPRTPGHFDRPAG